MSNDQPKLVILAEMWERTSSKGNKYYSGYLGKAGLVMFDKGEQPHPHRPDETVRVWRLFVQEREPALAKRHRLAREIAAARPSKPQPAPAWLEDPVDDLGR